MDALLLTGGGKQFAIKRRLRLVFAFLLSSILPIGPSCSPGLAQLSGHGGPVRALAVSEDGGTALSGSFDTSAILWDLRRNSADQVLRFHEGAVNAVAFLNSGHWVTAGADTRIALWTAGNPAPDRVLSGHAGPVAALAVSPAGNRIASASWDRTVRLWPLAGGEPTVLSGHTQNVNGVAFLPDGAALVSAGYDATVRIWLVARPDAPVVVELPPPLNAVAVAPDGEIAAAGADGRVYMLSRTGERLGAVEATSAPIVALALSRDGRRLAAASVGGEIAIIEPKARAVLHTLTAAGPIWAAAFLPDSRTLLTGGADRVIRRWDAETGTPLDRAEPDLDDPLAAYAGDRGAAVFRACAACHALTADAGNRAGPSLHGIFGRRIATLPGYNYSEPLKHLDIVWTPETLAKLFEIGPAEYTPGTKMPEQRIGSAEDRQALVSFLQKATR